MRGKLLAMTLSLDHDKLKADLDGAARTLGVSVRSVQRNEVCETTRVTRIRLLEVRLPKPCGIRARFVREGLVARARKLFADEVEVGAAVFDDHVFVITGTQAATARLLERKRVQVALLMLVDGTRSVEIDHDVIRVHDDDAPDDGRDATAELLAIVAHVLDDRAT